METQKTRHGKNELFMFKHGNRTSTLSLLGWHPCVISQPEWLWGLAYGFPRHCCGPSVRERWMINDICSRCPLSLGTMRVETLGLHSTSPLAAPGSGRHCLEVEKGYRVLVECSFRRQTCFWEQHLLYLKALWAKPCPQNKPQWRSSTG